MPQTWSEYAFERDGDFTKCEIAMKLEAFQNRFIAMSEIIQFPVSSKQDKSDLDELINEALETIPENAREKLRFELIKVIDSYDSFFTEWSMNMPEDQRNTLRRQIFHVARLEHDRKIRMLKDIVKLKIQVMVAEYHQRK